MTMQTYDSPAPRFGKEVKVLRSSVEVARKMIVKKCKLPEPSEREILKAILEYLKLRHVFAWRVNTGASILIHKGKQRYVQFGFPGVSDIIGILHGKRIRHTLNNIYNIPCNVGQFLAIEAKRPGKKLTADQEAFKIAVEENGGLFILAHSVEDVEKRI